MIKGKNLIIILVIILLVSCSRVPITNRNQFKMLPDTYMMSLSATNYKGFLSQNPALPASNANTTMVKNVGNNISSAITTFLKSKGHQKRIKNFKWEFNLVRNNAVNAWCMPGGKIVFYSGILPFTKDADGIAVVMGHEMAHAVAKHGNERMTQQLAIVLGGISLQVAMKEKPEQTRNIFLTAYGVGSTLGTLAYSRKHEYEADKLGMVFMAMGGYDPANCISFWERMASKGGTKPPEFLSTHPSDTKRIAEMKKFLPQAKKYYKK
ncbi:M48 family metallopeptidase [Bacteroidota bacterium]